MTATSTTACTVLAQASLHLLPLLPLLTLLKPLLFLLLPLLLLLALGQDGRRRPWQCVCCLSLQCPA